ncbi:solute carrier family 25 member 39 [Clonorchis sinensis]|uniref:Solute carrier family 25 member 39 n=1 Tax=Clonorchis sinensis TaxID=79923 RepID=G7Y8Q9_CLOSI|nr:solute carrier family 25 member 39 [Clonorchis sinensis]
MALPQTVIYYTLNDWLKELVGYPHAQRSRAVGTHLNLSATDWIPGLVGGVSRVCAVAVISPLELLRTKMQSYPMTPERLIRTLKDAISQSGLQSLWTGMGPTLLRDVPYSMICWLVFDYLKSRYLVGQLSGVHFSVSESVKLPVLPYGCAFLFGATAGLRTNKIDRNEFPSPIIFNGGLCGSRRPTQFRIDHVTLIGNG